MAAERLHGDDTTVPVLAKGKTITGRLWTYVRDDRPFGGPAPPAAMFYYSRDRGGEHPRRHLAGYRGILQADAYAGFNDLYSEARKPDPVTQALCWAHGRRNFFKLAELAKAPLAIEAVRRIDAIFDVERSINGLPAEQRRAVRQEQIAVLVDDLRELDARCAQQDVAPRRRGEGDRLHAQALGCLQPVPRRWEDLPDEQCRRTSAAGRCPWLARRGCSPVPIAAVSGPQRCIHSSSPPN